MKTLYRVITKTDSVPVTKQDGTQIQRGSMPQYKTPQAQLWELTDDVQHEIFRDLFRRLKKRDQEDLCYALIAWIKFKIHRPFESLFMKVIFQSLVELVNQNNKNSINAKSENYEN